LIVSAGAVILLKTCCTAVIVGPIITGIGPVPLQDYSTGWHLFWSESIAGFLRFAGVEPLGHIGGSEGLAVAKERMVVVEDASLPHE
jgi:hypothetical protein